MATKLKQRGGPLMALPEHQAPVSNTQSLRKAARCGEYTGEEVRKGNST